MTITYSEGGIRLLRKWHGSVWRAVWKDLLGWLILYYIIRFTLHYWPFESDQRQEAINVVRMFDRFCEKIPVSFLLGFFVVQIINRWWTQVVHIPWPDEVMLLTNTYFWKPEKKIVRQTVARWLILCQTMVFRRISTRIRRRFPKLDSLIDAGLMTTQERDIIRNTQSLNNRWQLPIFWIMTKLLAPSDLQPASINNYVNAVSRFQDCLRRLYLHDWIGVPLVYAQTCTVTVYGYFIFCAIGHQYIGAPVDLYVPWLTILQLIFYVGWLKVGQDLMRPFGEDDDDVELNCILDRNAAVAMNLADQVCEETPDLVEEPEKQKEFVSKMMNNMAYSRASLELHRDRPPRMHAHVVLKQHEVEMVCRTHSHSAPAEVNVSLRGDSAGETMITGFTRQNSKWEALEKRDTKINLF